MKVVETALLYAPSNSAKVTRMKAALIRSGVRVKLVKVEQFNQTIGDLIGLKQEQIDEIASSRVVGDASAGHEINENSLLVIIPSSTNLSIYDCCFSLI